MGVRKKKNIPGHDWPASSDADGHGTDFEPMAFEPEPFEPTPPPLTRTNAGYAPSDPLFPQQWHLFDAEGVDMDINVTRAWLDYTGRGVRVGVYDDAVEYRHPDLDGNYDASLHFRYGGVAIDPAPTGMLHHGTQVAGLIGAEQNGIGGVGVAFNASLTAVPIYGLIAPDSADYRRAAMDYQARFDVVNHSWGVRQPFTGTPHSEMYVATRAGIEHSAAIGREGLGTIMVVAAGNLRHSTTDEHGVVHHESEANSYAPHTNDRHVVTVAAAGADSYAATYSSPSANLLVTAPSRTSRDDLPGITTTDRTGEDGATATDYSDRFGGTSAATPLVSGVVALMLEANPDLGWRDVREILAYSSKHIGSDIGGPHHPHREKTDWQINHATDWNGGGLHFSRDYGFGLVDALAAVRLAETWSEQKTSANEEHAADSFAYIAPVDIPDGSDGGLTYRLEITENISVESVTLALDFAHPHADDQGNAWERHDLWPWRR
jgi:subtilisin family serine protease